MTINVSLNTISNLQDTTTAQTNINANSAAISGGFTTALNTTGDQMQGNLDMDSNQILNLPAPATMNSPVRLQDVISATSITYTVPATGTSGAVVGFLNGNNIWSGTNSFASITGTNLPLTNINNTFAGTQSFSSITATTINGSVTTNNVFIKGPYPWADIKAFGAVGDGTTDDTAAIQAAISSLTAANGGVCYIPSGNFHVTSTLNVPLGVSFLGVGNQSALTTHTSMTSTIFSITAGTANTFYEKLNIAGNPNSSVSAAIFNVPAGCGNIAFRDISAQQHGVAMSIGADACVIDNCFFMGNTGAVIVSGSNWFHGCTFDTSGTTTQQYSILQNSVTTTCESHFSQCDFSGYFTNACFVMADPNRQSIVTFSQCVFGNQFPTTAVDINATGGKWLSTTACEYGGNSGTTGVITVNTTSSPLISIVGCWAQSAFTTPTATVTSIVKAANFNIT